jgi:hypothetical protein
MILPDFRVILQSDDRYRIVALNRRAERWMANKFGAPDCDGWYLNKQKIENLKLNLKFNNFTYIKI